MIRFIAAASLLFAISLTPEESAKWLEAERMKEQARIEKVTGENQAELTRLQGLIDAAGKRWKFAATKSSRDSEAETIKALTPHRDRYKKYTEDSVAGLAKFKANRDNWFPVFSFDTDTQPGQTARIFNPSTLTRFKVATIDSEDCVYLRGYYNGNLLANEYKYIVVKGIPTKDFVTDKLFDHPGVFKLSGIVKRGSDRLYEFTYLRD
jgi:hypothetical protein